MASGTKARGVSESFQLKESVSDRDGPGGFRKKRDENVTVCVVWRGRGSEGGGSLGWERLRFGNR